MPIGISQHLEQQLLKRIIHVTDCLYYSEGGTLRLSRMGGENVAYVIQT